MNSNWMACIYKKAAVLFALISLFFAACVPTQSPPTPPSFTLEPTSPILTATAKISSSPTPTNTIIPKVDNPPTIAAQKPIELSPINDRNVGQLQVLFTHHVVWDALSYGVAAISPNRKWLALGAKYSSELYILPLIWTTENSIVPAIDTGAIRNHKIRVESLAFSPDSAYLAVAGDVSSVTVFALEHPGKTTILDVPNWPSAVTFVRDNRTLAVGTMRGLEGSVKIFDLETGTIKQEISKNTSSGGICSLGVSPDGKILAVGYCTYVFDISTWDIDKNYAHIARLIGLDEILYCAHFCTDNRNIISFDPATGNIASGTNYSRIPVQDVYSGKLITIISTARPYGNEGYIDAGRVNSLIYTPDGKILVIAANYELQLREALTGKLLWYQEETSGTLSAIALSFDGRLLISINSNGDIVFWGVPEN